MSVLNRKILRVLTETQRVNQWKKARVLFTKSEFPGTQEGAAGTEKW